MAFAIDGEGTMYAINDEDLKKYGKKIEKQQFKEGAKEIPVKTAASWQVCN
jgi:hypothetical protein